MKLFWSDWRKAAPRCWTITACLLLGYFAWGMVASFFGIGGRRAFALHAWPFIWIIWDARLDVAQYRLRRALEMWAMYEAHLALRAQWSGRS